MLALFGMELPMYYIDFFQVPSHKINLRGNTTI